MTKAKKIKTRFSIRKKLLIGMTIIFCLFTGANLYYTNNLIKSDKTAYIFENSLYISRQLKSEIENLIQSSEQIAKAMQVLHNAFPEKALALLNGQKDILAIGYLKQGQEVPSFLMKNIDEITKNEISDFKKLNLSAQTPLTHIPNKEILILNISSDQNVIKVAISLAGILERLRNNFVFDFVLFNVENNPIFSSRSFPTDQLKNHAINIKGSGSTVLDIDGHPYLSSYSEMSSFGGKIITLIPSKKAHLIIKSMTEKILAVGLIVMGLALVAGSSFSSKITEPINFLMEGVEDFSEGNLKKRVDIETRDEFKVLAENFNQMGDKIYNLLSDKEIMIENLNTANKKIEGYSKNLEQMVQTRTQELSEANGFIKAMINSLDQGLFVLDKNLKCLPIYTRSCEKIFNTSIAGKTFPEIIGSTNQSSATIEKWGELVFKELLPFESAVGLGPKKVETNDEDLIELNYFPMLNEQDKIENLVVVATDKTEEHKAKKEIRRKEKNVEMIYKIINNKKTFLNFIREADEYVHLLERAILNENYEANRFKLFLHTLSGGLYLYSIEDLGDQSRHLENLVSASDTQHEQLQGKIKDFLASYENFKTVISSTLNLENTRYELSKSAFQELTALVQQINKPSLSQFYENTFLKAAIKDFVFPYNGLIKSMATRLGKEIAPLSIQNGDIKVSTDRFAPFFVELVHLIRNCVDHGIESPEERENAGKSRMGKIIIRCSLSESPDNSTFLKISIEDNGRGINANEIRNKIGLTSSISQQTDSQVIMHIFDEGFTSRTQVGDYSGRGVGLSAVKKATIESGGRFSVKTILGKGTQFLFQWKV